jgi:hypothetical protein
VVTVAGTGRQLRERGGGGPALEQDLSTPADVAWFDGLVVVAMSGIHQLWAFDPSAGVVEVLAGTSNEGIVDGPRRRRGSRSRAGWRSPATCSGWPTRRARRCGG